MELFIAANFSKADEVRALIEDLGLMFVGENEQKVTVYDKRRQNQKR